METEVNTFAKSATLKFIGQNIQIRRMFISDVECSYCAEQIVYLFQNISHVILQVFVGIVSAYLFHQLYQKRNTKKSQEKLESQIRKILEEHSNQIDFNIKRLEEFINTHSRADVRKTRRYQTYIEKATSMKESEAIIPEILKILEGISRHKPEKQEKFVSKYRR